MLKDAPGLGAKPNFGLEGAAAYGRTFISTRTEGGSLGE
jgi:hypothetical protein